MNNGEREGPLTIPYQEIADSPTERYYTDWRAFNQLPTLPPAKELDTLQLEPGREECIFDLATGLEIGGCTGISAREWAARRPAVKERVAHLHYERTSGRGYWLHLNGGRLIVLLRGGTGHTGYNLRVTTEPLTRNSLVLADTRLSRGVTTYMIEARLGEESQLDLVHFHLYQQEAPAYGIVESVLGDGARLTYRLGGSVGRMSRIRSVATLAGEGSRFDGIIGVSSAGRGQGDIIVQAVHTAPRTISLIDGRGIARDYSRLTLRGGASIQGSAPKSRSRVLMHVLVVGGKARGRSVPVLEIFTGDVEEASHSAAVTSLGEEVFFYAATRGLEEREILRLVQLGLWERSGALKVAERLGLLGFLG